MNEAAPCSLLALTHKINKNLFVYAYGRLLPMYQIMATVDNINVI